MLFRSAGPEAAEEVFTVVANSPQDAIDQVKRLWTGPIDRIEIVDVNPEDDNEAVASLFDDVVMSRIYYAARRANIDVLTEIDPDGVPHITIDMGNDELNDGLSVTIETRPIDRNGDMGWEFIPTIRNEAYEDSYPTSIDPVSIYKRWSDIAGIARAIYEFEFYPNDYVED